MAKVYTINCPKCGCQFEVMKGILVSESDLDPIPEERQEETPFTCPICGQKMFVQYCPECGKKLYGRDE